MLKQRAVFLMRDNTPGLRARLLRLPLRLLEIPYTLVMRARNHLYDRNILPARSLGRATISIGNLTTGGTGKTPLVRWLAEQLHQRGWSCAILLRGYAAKDGQSDEESELRQLLQSTNDNPTLVKAGPDRLASARAILADHPKINLFLLDDAFQHRRAGRDLDVVLINAAEPFGFDHVLPRGLLREPLIGLNRADAIVLTRADAVSSADLDAIIQTIKTHNPAAPIYKSRHVITGWTDASGNLHPADAIRNQPVHLICGIGDPDSFGRHIRSMGANVVGSQIFPDHHAYTRHDLNIPPSSAGLLLTTEKDWVKIAPLLTPDFPTNIRRARLELQWLDGDAEKLMALIDSRLGKSRIP
ncbi:MAG: tetraacyldisaccharide 4'-kinase [Phycisphaerales bacterium]|nr:tetraacyldisaccharide 4'-kinase [Phycisphaerales bacterium]